jgi:hypothetical protein
MNIVTIKISLVIFLIVGCSPDHKKNNIDINTLSEGHIVEEPALGYEWLAKIELSEKNLQTAVKNQTLEHEKKLLEDADNLQVETEKQLLTAQEEEMILAEEALLESAKTRAGESITQ